MAKAKQQTVEMNSDDDSMEGTLYQFSESIDEAEAPEPLPERQYPATITDVEDRTTNDGRPMVRVVFKINEEDYPADYDAGNAPGGKSISHFQMMDDSAQTRHRVRKFCEAIGAPMSKRLNPKNDWMNLSATVTIKHEEYEGVNREKISRIDSA